jgi:hypothetical protein
VPYGYDAVCKNDYDLWLKQEKVIDRLLFLYFLFKVYVTYLSVAQIILC